MKEYKQSILVKEEAATVIAIQLTKKFHIVSFVKPEEQTSQIKNADFVQEKDLDSFSKQKIQNYLCRSTMEL